jgi:hypothetical protein
VENYNFKKTANFKYKKVVFIISVLFLGLFVFVGNHAAANVAPAMTSAGYDLSLCCGNDIHGYLIWDFTDPDPGDFQKQYRVQLWKGADETGTLLIDETVISTEKKYQIDTGIIEYGESYHFKPTTWDSAGAINNPSATNTFNLPGPAMSADFSWNPAIPEAGQTIDFFNNPGAFPPYGWSWDFDDDSVEDDNVQNPSYIFASAGNYDVTLKVRHLIAGTYCKVGKNITVNPDTTSPTLVTEAWIPDDTTGIEITDGGIVDFEDIDEVGEFLTIYSNVSDGSGTQDQKIKWWRYDSGGTLIDKYDNYGEDTYHWDTTTTPVAGGLNSLTITGPLNDGDVIEYQAEATDTIPNPTAYDPADGVTKYSFTVVTVAVPILVQAWPQAGQNAQHTGFSSLVGTSSMYGIKWSKDLNIGGDSFASPVSADVDGDGKDEIIVMGTRLVYDENGDIWGPGINCKKNPANPMEPDYCSDGSQQNESSPAVGDVDGDGSLEIVGWRETGEAYLYCKDAATGNLEWSLDSVFGGEVFTDLEDFNRAVFPIIYDLDNDGKEEIFIVGGDNMYVLNGTDGSIIWKATVPGGTYSIPAVGDINGDGQNEVVLEHRWDGDESVKAWDLNGNELWNKKLFLGIGGSYLGYTVLADVDPAAPGMEVIVEIPGTLYVLNGNNGNILWQALIEEDISTPSYPTWSASPAVADIDDDGKLEIIVPVSLDSGDRLMTLNGEDGSLVWKIPLGENIWIAPVVADLDNDGKEEIVAPVKGGPVYIINAEDGSIRQSIAVSNDYHRYMAISDVDGDNEAEIIVVI